MAVLKEFRCKAHGAFETFVKQDAIPRCPNGCPARFVVREFRTAPAIRGVATGRLDSLQKDLALDYGLPDIKVGKDDGNSVMQNLRSETDFSPKWLDLPNKPAPGWTQRGEKPTAFSPKALGLMDGNSLSSAQLPKQLPTKIEGSYKGETT
jgi:hypothetical protein